MLSKVNGKLIIGIEWVNHWKSQIWTEVTQRLNFILDTISEVIVTINSPFG